MPRLLPFPNPKLRYHGSRWRIIWRWNRRQYSVPTEYLDREKTFGAVGDLRLIAAALAMDKPEFPAKYQDSPDVKKYLVERYGGGGREGGEEGGGAAGGGRHDFDALFVRFKKHAKLEYSAGHYNSIVRSVEALRDAKGDLGLVTPAQGRDFLASVLENDSKAATRNRALVAIRTFYNWLVEGEYLTVNPFREIKQLGEARGEKDITYCTREERDRIIAMARDSGWRDWLAVPIAFYAGLRRGEIARMRWQDVRFSERRIAVPKSKTKVRRILPLAEELQKILEAVPEARRVGYVVDMPPGDERLMRLGNLARKIDKLTAGRGVWKKEPDKNKTEAERGKVPIPHERIGWNAWRHTFGSLLAQSGVSLDKISSWMGNTPEVCRRHYAQFVPRDRHDDEIDRLR